MLAACVLENSVSQDRLVVTIDIKLNFHKHAANLFERLVGKLSQEFSLVTSTTKSTFNECKSYVSIYSLSFSLDEPQHKSNLPKVFLRKGVPKICSKHTGRTPMPKCDFNEVAKQPYWNHTPARVFSLKLLHIFRTLFPRNTSAWLALTVEHSITTWIE